MNFMIHETANSTNKTILISSVFNLHKERQTDRGLVTSHSWCQVSPTWEFVNVSTQTQSRKMLFNISYIFYTTSVFLENLHFHIYMNTFYVNLYISFIHNKTFYTYLLYIIRHFPILT